MNLNFDLLALGYWLLGGLTAFWILTFMTLLWYVEFDLLASIKGLFQNPKDLKDHVIYELLTKHDILARKQLALIRQIIALEVFSDETNRMLEENFFKGVQANEIGDDFFQMGLYHVDLRLEDHPDPKVVQLEDEFDRISFWLLLNSYVLRFLVPVVFPFANIRSSEG